MVDRQGLHRLVIRLELLFRLRLWAIQRKELILSYSSDVPEELIETWG
jgi:hypothetical protein